jgi:hypothetical protein
MDINIGMKRDRIALLVAELSAAAEKTTGIEVTLYGKDNDTGREVMVTISNDDMERDEVATDDIYVEVSR